MDDTEKQMFLNAGQAVGWALTCGHKINYSNEKSANKAAVNQTEKYGKPLESYPCCFCDGWHVWTALTEQERIKFS